MKRVMYVFVLFLVGCTSSTLIVEEELSPTPESIMEDVDVNQDPMDEPLIIDESEIPVEEEEPIEKLTSICV